MLRSNDFCIVARHQVIQLLRAGRNALLKKLTHFFKVVNIARRRKCVQETGCLVRWIAEGMERANRHHYERSHASLHGLCPHQELQIPFEDVKDLFVSMMDMRRRRWRMRWYLKLSNT